MSNPFNKTFASGGSFLPEDYVAKKAETRANIITLMLFAVVMAGVTGAFVVTTRTWHALKQEQQTLKAEYETEAKKIDQLKALEAKRQEILEKAELTAALAERVPRWALLAELTLRMPDDMNRDLLTLKGKRIEAPAAQPVNSSGQPLIRSLTGKGNNKPAEKPKVRAPQFEYQLTLAGTAVRNNDVADYIAALRESPVLRDVELQFIREAKEGEKVVRKFELLAMVKTDVDPKIMGESLEHLVAEREKVAQTKAAAEKAAEQAASAKAMSIKARAANPKPAEPQPQAPAPSPTPSLENTPANPPQAPTTTASNPPAPETTPAPTQEPSPSTPTTTVDPQQNEPPMVTVPEPAPQPQQPQ